MPELSKKERVRAALQGRPVDRAPVSLWGHDFLREWEPRELVAATLDSYRANDWDFIKLNPRSTYFAEAWGNRYDRPDAQRQPRLQQAMVTSTAQLAALEPVDPRGGVFAEHLTALRLLVEEVGEEVDILQTIFSPLGVLATLAGGEQPVLELAAEDAAATHHALAVLTGVLDEYARASLAAGAAGLFYAPLRWPSHDYCSENFFREFGRPYDLQILHPLRSAPFNVLHVCRDHNMIDLLLDYPVTAFNWADHGEGNPGLAEVLAKTDKAVIGGVEHTRLHEVAADVAATQARAAAAVGPSRVMVGPGCSIPPATPAETAAAVARAARGG